MSEIAKKKSVRQYWKSLPLPDKSWVESASQIIVDLIVRSEEFKAAKQVSLFAGLPWEPDLSGVWRAAPQKCVFPKIDKTKDRIDFFCVSTLADLTPGNSKILEPPLDKPARAWSPGDIILVPAMALDRTGNRMGSGKGYYDRFLSEIPREVKRWGVVFHERVSKTPLPVESYDQKIDLILSEAGRLSVTHPRQG